MCVCECVCEVSWSEVVANTHSSMLLFTNTLHSHTHTLLCICVCVYIQEGKHLLKLSQRKDYYKILGVGKTASHDDRRPIGRRP